MSTPMVFMGSCPFALRILQRLEKKFPIHGVFTAPPKPKGRGHVLTQTCVHDHAQSQGIPVYTPSSLRGDAVLAELKKLNPTVIVVASYGLLLPQSVLDLPRAGCVNVHPSILPRWRGASPLVYPLLMGESETGVALMRMDAGMDTGPILIQKRMNIPPRTTLADLSLTLAHMGGEALCEVLPDYLSGRIQPQPQATEGMTLAPKIHKEMGFLTWADSAFDLLRKIDALQPWPGTWGGIRDANLRFLQADAAEYSGPETVGSVVPWQRSWAVVCGSKSVFIPTLLRSPQGKTMDGETFMRGHSSLLFP